MKKVVVLSLTCLHLAGIATLFAAAGPYRRGVGDDPALSVDIREVVSPAEHNLREAIILHDLEMVKYHLHSLFLVRSYGLKEESIPLIEFAKECENGTSVGREIVRYLMEARLALFVRLGPADVKAVEKILDDGRAYELDICCIAPFFGTPIIFNSVGKVEILKLLLARGANPACIHKEHDTILHAASAHEKGVLALPILLEYPAVRALINKPRANGTTPLSGSHDLNFYVVLLKAGACLTEAAKFRVDCVREICSIDSPTRKIFEEVLARQGGKLLKIAP